MACWWTVAGCSSEEPLPTPIVPDAQFPGLIHVAHTLTPPVVAPGRTVTLDLRVADRGAAELFITRGGTTSPVSLTRSGADWVGSVAFSAGDAVGDEPVEIAGTVGDLQAYGGLLVHVTHQKACDAGAILEAGACVEPAVGHRIQMERIFRVHGDFLQDFRGSEPHDSRDHAGDLLSVGDGVQRYPRASVLLNDAVISCTRNFLEIVARQDMLAVASVSGAAHSDSDTAVASVSVPMSDYGLERCETMAVYPPAGVIIVGGPGGLATAAMPSVDAPASAPPTHVATLAHTAGFAGMALEGDRLYTVRKPASVVVFELQPGAKLVELGAVDIGQPVSLDALTVVEGRVSATASASNDTAGRVYVVELSQPSQPAVLGWAPLSGVPRGITSLGDHVVAAAVGSSGIDLVDVSDPAQPTVVYNRRTPTPALDLTSADGYLVVGTWDALYLYDASDPGVLRLLESSDAAIEPGDEEAGLTHRFYDGLRAASDVWFDGTDLVVSDFDTILTGTLHPGRDAGSLNLHDRQRVYTFPETGGALSLATRFSNGGRLPLLVRVKDTESVTAVDALQIVQPGAEATIEFSIVEPASAAARDEFDDPPTAPVYLENSAPASSPRVFLVGSRQGGYTVGDKSPQFRVPQIQGCTETACPAQSSCFDTADPAVAGRPIVLAFFSPF